MDNTQRNIRVRIIKESHLKFLTL